MNDTDNDVAAVTETKQLSEYRTIRNVRLDQYRQFTLILKLKYNNDEEEINKNEEYEFDHVILLGLKEWKKEETGYEIIHNGKPADARILKKLGKIATLLFHLNTYPILDANYLHAILNKAIGNMDSRVLRSYRKTVLYYCNVDEDIIENCRDSRLGTLNVSGFVKRIPSSFLLN